MQTFIIISNTIETTSFKYDFGEIIKIIINLSLY